MLKEIVNQGNKCIVLNIFESGSQHVDTIHTQNVGAYPQPETLPSPPCVGREKEPSHLPEVLATDEAMTLWKKAQAAGWADTNYQPLISRTWKTFETLWNRKNMRSDYNLALRQQQSLDFLTELKRIL